MRKPPLQAAALPDAAPENWVDRRAPEGLKPWLKLGRFDRPIGIWLLLLPGWQGIALAAAERGDLVGRWAHYGLLMALFAVGAALMRAAGCAWNDIVDRDIDARVARTASRPIPAGQISVGQALAFIIGCCLISLVVLLSFNATAVIVGALSLLLVAAYPFMKRITWWPQAWLGLTFNWGALLGFTAATGAVGVLWTALGSGAGLDAWTEAPGRLGVAALFLYASGVCWTLGYDTIYALQDIEDDALVGVKSSARRLGAKAPLGVLIFYVLACLFAIGAWAAAGLGPLFFPPFALFAVHLSNQVKRLKIGEPALALALFKSNRGAGLLLFAALAAGAWR